MKDRDEKVKEAAQLINYYLIRGYSVRDIAKEIGESMSFIYQVLENEYYDFRTQFVKITPDTVSPSANREIGERLAALLKSKRQRRSAPRARKNKISQ